MASRTQGQSSHYSVCVCGGMGEAVLNLDLLVNDPFKSVGAKVNTLARKMGMETNRQIQKKITKSHDNSKGPLPH